MMWNIHGEPTTPSVDLNPAAIGVNTIVAANANGETFIHALAIVVDGACVLTYKTGNTVVGVFKLAANQTISVSDLRGS